MQNVDIKKMGDPEKLKLVDNRWSSSEELWDTVTKVYDANTAIYSNKASWLSNIPYVRQNWVVQANRIFVNMEAVINSLIANPPGITILPGRTGPAVQEFARDLQKYMRKKFIDINIKETVRKGLRNLYFGRIIVLKAFWNPAIDDFDFRAIDPRKVRFGKYATKEQDTEFAIEEIEDNLCSVIARFPKKKEELMRKYGLMTEEDLYIKNPDVKYKEAWVQQYVIFKLDTIVLDTIKNPYWDWDGILLTQEERQQLDEAADKEVRRALLQPIKLDQDMRRQAYQLAEATKAAEDEAGTEQVMDMVQPEGGEPPVAYEPYYFNYFDEPRKPYIFATVFNNENSPVGRTDMITLSADLQRGIDKRKMDIDENAEMVNGILKVDAGVMGKADAQRIRFQTKGVIWGKNVGAGVTREVGQGLPAMVFEDMQDSRSEIDNIMAASSAFKGEREGQETKAGRLALIQQSYLRLNELVQTVDYVYGEAYSWGMQLSKSRYTEYRESQWMDEEGANRVMDLIQDDFEEGQEVVVVPGKTLPVDDEFKFEQAQNDVKAGFISPVDYLKIAQYDDPKDLAKNNVLYHLSPVAAVNLTPEEMAKIPPPDSSKVNESVAYKDLPPSAKAQVLEKLGIQVAPEEITAEGMVSPVSIAFKDLPLDGKIQAAAKLGIELDPTVLMAEQLAEAQKGAADQKHQVAMEGAKQDQKAKAAAAPDNG